MDTKTETTKTETTKTVDLNGRPEYPATLADLDGRLDEKNAALADKIEAMQKQDAETLASYVNSSKSVKVAKSK
jgi:hypothetical protein